MATNWKIQRRYRTSLLSEGNTGGGGGGGGGESGKTLEEVRHQIASMSAGMCEYMQLYLDTETVERSHPKKHTSAYEVVRV